MYFYKNKIYLYIASIVLYFICNISYSGYFDAKVDIRLINNSGYDIGDLISCDEDYCNSANYINNMGFIDSINPINPINPISSISSIDLKYLPYNYDANIYSFSMPWSFSYNNILRDLNFSIYSNHTDKNKTKEKVGTCNLHIETNTSYYFTAKPDFIGSVCKLTNGDYLQLAAYYEVINGEYKISFILSKNKTFSRMVLFGDSLSDTGNLRKFFIRLAIKSPGNTTPIIPKDSLYYQGRFTNGQVWAEHLYQAFNIPKSLFINHAHAGARIVKDYYPVPTLAEQIDYYLSRNTKSDPYALYIIWIGGNDVLRHAENNSNQNTDLDMVKTALLESQANIVKLINNGAKHILLPVIPDISHSPEIYHLGQDYMNRVNKITKLYNDNFIKIINNLNLKYPEVNIITFDVYSTIRDIYMNYEKYGFKIIYTACNPNDYSNDAYMTCDNPDEYLFWDQLHPSKKAHEMLFDNIYIKLLKYGYTPNTIEYKNKNLNFLDAFAYRNDDIMIDSYMINSNNSAKYNKDFSWQNATLY